MSLAGLQTKSFFVSAPCQGSLCAASNTLTRLRARARSGTGGWDWRLRLVLPIEPSGKLLLVWEGATCATHRTTGGQGVQLGWGQGDGGQSCALLVVWLWEPSPGLWGKGVASSGLWGGGESPSSHLFCFLLFCGALPLEAYAVAMYLLVCISPALVPE